MILLFYVGTDVGTDRKTTAKQTAKQDGAKGHICGIMDAITKQGSAAAIPQKESGNIFDTGGQIYVWFQKAHTGGQRCFDHG